MYSYPKESQLFFIINYYNIFIAFLLMSSILIIIINIKGIKYATMWRFIFIYVYNYYHEELIIYFPIYPLNIIYKTLKSAKV